MTLGRSSCVDCSWARCSRSIAVPAFAQAKKEPIALRDMGSFHVGGRIIEITGQPVKEVVFTPGGVPAKVDPNGKYPDRADLRPVLLLAEQERKAAAAAAAWRWPLGRHL